MKKHRFVYPLLSLLTATLISSSGSQAVIAQDNASTNEVGEEEKGITGFWEVVAPGGRFAARVSHITSVSEHEYLIDATMKIYECTVDTIGGQVGRFYYIEPLSETLTLPTGTGTINRLKDVATQAAARVGVTDIETVVTKHYPETTHAKTSEYRLNNKATVKQIYDHLRRVWAEEQGNGQANRLTIRNS